MPVETVPAEAVRHRYQAMFGWTLAACAIAGVYGAVHNQVSYTVSPDYFHAFKFDQFEFSAAWRHRGGASVVGFLASWWTGLAMGPLLFMAAWGRGGASPSSRRMLSGFGVILVIAIMFGIAGLAYASNAALPQPKFWIPRDARDPAAFHRAGMLHDASYLGAAAGTIVACFAIRWNSRRAVNQPPHQPPGPE